MSELVTTRIRDAASRLHLANLAESLEALVARAEGATMGYLEFLDLVLEEETGVREGRRFRNALKLSGLPHHKTLDEFDFAFQPDLDPRKVKDRWPRWASSRPGSELEWVQAWRLVVNRYRFPSMTAIVLAVGFLIGAHAETFGGWTMDAPRSSARWSVTLT